MWIREKIQALSWKINLGVDVVRQNIMSTTNQLTAELHAVEGVRTASVCANIRYPDRLDLVLIELAPESSVAGVFTQNAFCAAPVQVAKKHLAEAIHTGSAHRYLVINTGNANAGTGDGGVVDALSCCRSIADMAGVPISNVLPFSTGVIGEKLPMDKIVPAIPDAFLKLGSQNWQDAAAGIMTTDTRPKAISRKIALHGKTIVITGIAKGSGMIKPNMATLLAFVFTDAQIEQDLLKQLLRDNVSATFNRISVDGDTSTNDSCLLVASGKGGVSVTRENSASLSKFSTTLREVFVELAQGLIRDAEGATKFVTIHVQQGSTSEECLRVAYAIAESPLVKTALFASDPNWGRILAVVGRADIVNLNINELTIDLGNVRIVENGTVSAGYTETAGQEVMDREDIDITVSLARGQFEETVWTSDLSHDYIRINAEYRT